MNEKTVGVFSLRAAERNDYQSLSNVELSSLSIMAASESGYLRIYTMRERKLLENAAQLNIQD